MKIISLQDVAPTINPNSPAHVAGTQVHRRVLSATKDGPKSIDVGYNTFKAGVTSDRPYAYTKDEFCYIPAGELKAESSGVTQIVLPGTFMWRPARVATHQVLVQKDSVSICAFGPAREDDWSHRLPLSEIGWDGDESKRRLPRYLHYTSIAPSPLPEAPDDARIVHRRVISEDKDGSVHMELSHTTFDAGVTLGPSTNRRDDVCWLESGEMRFTAGGEEMILEAGEFIYRPAGTAVERIEVVEKSVLIRYSAPPYIP
jgi:quercetin dioxygenase-like cupin family protein